VFISLPKEFISLNETPKGFNPEYKHAIHYLTQRGITEKDIVKYNIGYCKEGLYGQRIIIPSYNSDGSLNYFVSRSYYPENKMKYKNPPISKNVICFDSQVNWNEPIILCEGVFDAITIKRNAIPLFGKTISKALMIKLLQSDVQTVYLALDDDAIRESIDHAQKLLDLGKEVYIIKLEGKDPSELGFENMISCLQSAKPLTATDLLLLKMQTALC
jgi:DNA primase